MKQFAIFTLSIFLCYALQSQVIFSDGFEDGDIGNWTVQSNATDGGWNVGSPGQLSSQSFTVDDNGSNFVIGTNDDACNCDKSNDRLISPPIDLSMATAAQLNFDLVFLDNIYEGDQENGYVEISTDGNNWDLLYDFHGHGFWDTHNLDISSYVGNSTVQIAFVYDDGGGWLYGCAIDNISVDVPLTLDADIVSIENVTFSETNVPISIESVVYNNGVTEIDELNASVFINGDELFTETFTNQSIGAFEYGIITFMTPWTPSNIGAFDLEVVINTVNGQTDEIADNNSISGMIQIYSQIITPNLIDNMLFSTPVIETIATAADNLDKPNDLDFFPVKAKDEVWIVNEREENIGGSTLTIEQVSSDNPIFTYRVDGNAWHFMSMPTGIAFSDDNLNFGTSPGILDANHGGGSFTGPTLWSSDPVVYAQPSGGNGSHLDMLHGSPFSMGIAHEQDNVFWVYDNHNKDIVRYDFVEDHGPGNDDHSDGIVRRFKNIGINADGNTANHMVLDKETGWLYFTDNGNDRVIRLDINSGTSATDLPLTNETLAEHSSILGFTHEVIIDNGISKPCGIEIFGDRLLVGDYDNGDIHVYDMSNDFVEIGVLETNDAGLTGLKIGPNGYLYYVNRLQNTLSSMAPETVQIEMALEGFLQPDGTMSTAYSDNGLISENQPFSSLFNYNGMESTTAFPVNTTDWIYVELRDANDITSVVHQEALLLRNDGAIMDLSGNTRLNFEGVAGDHYILVNHRSHLGVITAEPINVTNNETLSFNAAIATAMGVEQLIAVDGTAALFAGDFDGSGVINVADFNLWRSDNAAVNAYNSYDADGNGVINVADYNYWFKNRSKVGNVNVQP